MKNLAGRMKKGMTKRQRTRGDSDDDYDPACDSEDQSSVEPEVLDGIVDSYDSLETRVTDLSNQFNTLNTNFNDFSGYFNQIYPRPLPPPQFYPYAPFYPPPPPPPIEGDDAQ
jgi:hypothetical protein